MAGVPCPSRPAGSTGDWVCHAEETWIVCDLHLAPWQPDMWDAAAGGRVFHVQWLSMECLMRFGWKVIWQRRAESRAWLTDKRIVTTGQAADAKTQPRLPSCLSILRCMYLRVGICLLSACLARAVRPVRATRHARPATASECIASHRIICTWTANAALDGLIQSETTLPSALLCIREIITSPILPIRETHSIRPCLRSSIVRAWNLAFQPLAPLHCMSLCSCTETETETSPLQCHHHIPTCKKVRHPATRSPARHPARLPATCCSLHASF